MPDPLFPTPRRPALRAYQARVLRGLLRAVAARPAAPLTVLMPRQSGKNEIAGALVACLLRANAHEGGTVVVCAPTLDPQARISADRIRAALAAARTGRLTLPRDDGSSEASRCREELAACEASLATGGRLAWGNDRDHDDYVVSLALCLRAAESAGAPRVAVGRGRR